MDLLWAPWREAYVVKSGRKNKKEPCIFCALLKEKKDSRNFIFLRSRFCFAVLNIYPFNAGHSMVIPYRHVSDLSGLTDEERKDLLDVLVAAKELLRKALRPHAFNVGLNLGHLAGAGIPEHLHAHIVPRWSGDVNFMPALFGAKVMPVSLKSVFRAIKNARQS